MFPDIKSQQFWILILVAMALAIASAKFQLLERFTVSRDRAEVTSTDLRISISTNSPGNISSNSNLDLQKQDNKNLRLEASIPSGRQDPIKSHPSLSSHETRQSAQPLPGANFNSSGRQLSGNETASTQQQAVMVTPKLFDGNQHFNQQRLEPSQSTNGVDHRRMQVANPIQLISAYQEQGSGQALQLEPTISLVPSGLANQNNEQKLVLPSIDSLLAPGARSTPGNAESQPPTKPMPYALRSSEALIRLNDQKISLRLNNEDLRAVLELISVESGLSILPSENVTGTVTANISNVTAREALQAILFSTGFQILDRDNFVFIGTPEDFIRMERVSQVAETRVYRPCFVSAAELKQLIESQLTDGVGSIMITSSTGGGLQSSGAGSGSSSSTGGSSSGGSSGRSIEGYTGNDILVIRDMPLTLQRLDVVIRQVDVPPLQVAIEALILSVKLDDQHRLGVNLELLRGNGVRVVSGSLPGTLDSLETGQGLLSLGFLDAHVGSFLAALDDIGETNVIAAPHVLALNKMPAEILIGEQIGFANTTVTQTAATQSIQFLEVGTQLQILPHVNDEGMIRLEIHPEVSTGTVRSVGDLALPEKTVTQVTTNVMCRDNETIIIGGLIREETDDVHRGIPLLGKMPILGPFFRSRQRNTTREELLILLTPHVIRDPSDALPDPRIVEGFVDRRAEDFRPERKNWFVRKKEADRYYNLASNAFVSGNYDVCQRYVRIALDLDPENQNALSLMESCIRRGEMESEAGDNYMPIDQDVSNLPNSEFESSAVTPADPSQSRTEARPQVDQASYKQQASVQQTSVQQTSVQQTSVQQTSVQQTSVQQASGQLPISQPDRLQGNEGLGVPAAVHSPSHLPQRPATKRTGSLWGATRQ